LNWLRQLANLEYRDIGRAIEQSEHVIRELLGPQGVGVLHAHFHDPEITDLEIADELDCSERTIQRVHSLCREHAAVLKAAIGLTG
jgi:hypothetical protein